MSSDHCKEYDSEPGLDAHYGHQAIVPVGLLSGSQSALPIPIPDSRPRTLPYQVKHLLASFVFGGILGCLAVQFSPLDKIIHSCMKQTASNGVSADNLYVRAAPWAGSTDVDSYPPLSPTNDFPDLFPTDVGYLGPTPTGAEPAIIATAPTQPLQTGAAAIVAPPYSSLPDSWSNEPGFNIFRSWGNLSPWYSVPIDAFGINEGAAPPAGCDVKGLYLLYRHGARYPGSDSGTARLAQKLHDSADKWSATGRLAFLNDWTYKLGEEVLTAFGRQQEYDLGVSMRLKYGFLLDTFTKENTLPVFRTTSEDRMVASGVNFALGFFGWPLEGQYEQAIMIESLGFNNTLAPWNNCPNAFVESKAYRSKTYVDKWRKKYLHHAKKRLQHDLQGFDLTTDDVYHMQEMCVYETVSLGYSQFCELFSEEEWTGFDYSIDLDFWYDDAFGSPVARVQGLGYVQELVSRLTQTPITTYNSSTNSTWDADSRTWPLGNVLYADATHDVVIANILTALNLTSLAVSGPLPDHHIPSDLSFVTSELVPFGSNVQFQLLSCPALSGQSDDEASHIRIVVNDGPVPLTGVGACPESSSGLCPLPTFIAAQQETAENVDWYWGCYGDWEVPSGSAWETTGGWYPGPQPGS